MRAFLLGGLLLASLLTVESASAQQIKNGAASGRLVSGSVLSANEVVQPIPGVRCLPNEKLIITTACVFENTSGYICHITGSSGSLRVLSTLTDGSPKCVTYSPGLDWGASGDVICHATGSAGNADCTCSVTGICSRR